MKEEALFQEFEPVSAKQWKQQIQYDLKGADYSKTLVWESLEGIKVKPFYNSEDRKGLPSYHMPEDHSWRIGQSFFGENPKATNIKALDAMKRGADSLLFELPNAPLDWNVLLQDLSNQSAEIHLHPPTLEVDAIKNLVQYSATMNGTIHLHLDCIGHLARTGNWYKGITQDFEAMDRIWEVTATHGHIRSVSVDMARYQNAGANMVQQLAYGLAHANEYLEHWRKTGRDIPSRTMLFKVAVGSNYFFEIAKLRALRWLWASLVKAHGVDMGCFVLALPSRRNKTLYDYNVNLLRTTTECMAAILGGADTIANAPYDTLYHKENEFGDRLARNQLLLLKEESYFHEAVHAANGAYYIDALTEQLAQKALQLFKQLEASGGFLNELKKGIVQKKIKASAEREQQLFDDGQIISIGTNAYQNPQDRMKDQIERSPFLKQQKRKTLIPPIVEKRLSASLEKNRLENEG